ncbi:MAG: DUF1851 domain-containing protein [Puia sp.]|nr:DUF1851 domain-containing protein [Puia sp.]
MFEKFMSAYEPVAESSDDDEFEFSDNFPSDFSNLIKECGGFSFKNGLYRTHTLKSCIRWGQIIGKFFPGYPGCWPFGYDWMGRQFCIHRSTGKAIYMFDPSTGEDFTVQFDNISDFHNEGLVDGQKDLLSESIFIEIRYLLNIKRISYNDCLGYKIPLFLNGTDSIENYELSNMEVYWEIQGQLFSQIK